MHKQFPRFNAGQKLRVRVEELLDSQFMLVSLDGLMMRVLNDSDQDFLVGESIEVLVVRTHPLQLRLEGSARKFFERFA